MPLNLAQWAFNTRHYTPLKTVTVRFQCTSTHYEHSRLHRCSGITVTLCRLPSGWLRLSEEERLLQQTARFDPPQQREAGPQAERRRLVARQRAQEPWVTIQIRRLTGTHSGDSSPPRRPGGTEQPHQASCSRVAGLLTQTKRREELIVMLLVMRCDTLSCVLHMTWWRELLLAQTHLFLLWHCFGWLLCPNTASAQLLTSSVVYLDFSERLSKS